MGDLLEKHLEAQKKTQQRLPSPAKTKALKRKRFVLLSCTATFLAY